MFPAEALADALLGRGARLTLVTDRRGEAFGGTLGRLETRRILAGGIAGRGLVGRARGAVELGLGLIQALGLLRRLDPDVVVGFGGYASLPPLLAAIRQKRPTVVHEQNALPGRANRMLAPRVSRFAVAFAHGQAPAGITPVWTGMPVRPAVLALRDEPYQPAGADEPFRLLVTGGSQGARVFSTLLPEAIALLPDSQRQRLHLTLQSRPEDLEAAQARVQDLGLAGVELSSFFTDLPRRLAQAHLVVCRSGASTMGELAVLGRPAVLIPYPHAIDDHQTANARGMDEAGGGWLMPQGPLTPQALAERLEALMNAPEALARAARCARAVGVPDAAARLADLVLATARTREIHS
ncbi:UDP-N-acetylglucosamine--N-acetylmuramyl-(pentapeptide) pyrophosphoryl-undecaprenol N-acetylglucosamine transferase [Pararhodospirillum oryzae]|nr:UDP-N-acetylglucosamine--N-acetylmuramyl-(pentapeptide) pyrophosphoryl-undecaprenol N-acetylglucosamine transferase [Pararhodospirillum oryzae]